MLPSLTDDAIFEILSWVPVKPACRLRCVSRAWRALISSPAFLTTHKSRVEPLLLSVTTSSPPEFNGTLRLMDIDGNIIRVIEKPGFWTIKDSSHGPVCVCIANYDVSVIDLATLNVVRTSAELNHESFCSLNVGCAIPSRKYKVVCLMSKHDPCKILTLEDGAKWRQVKSAPTPPLLTNGYNLGSAVTLNGVMDFLYKVATPQVDDYYVLGFDLESELATAGVGDDGAQRRSLHDGEPRGKYRGHRLLDFVPFDRRRRLRLDAIGGKGGGGSASPATEPSDASNRGQRRDGWSDACWIDLKSPGDIEGFSRRCSSLPTAAGSSSAAPSSQAQRSSSPPLLTFFYVFPFNPLS
ncbi:hypothetical protein QYE76_024384 [Lolium multiflorum]|uniref:F-box domain-containing protein n=1 Tax=Lolium multiflorum TaxID=4521 RepID=A0AAD8RER0_LOLMU|nr:hypothetical protein QYE76_024384 [Lolium multiflorum]